MWTVVVGVAGTLIGIVLGSLLSAQAQLRLQRLAHLQSELASRREAYVEYLSTLRRFRRFILHISPVDITVVEGSGSPRGPIPVIKDAEGYWDAVENARSRLWIVAGHDSDVRRASDAVMDALYILAREQASYEVGALPAEIIDISREAERKFAEMARLDLNEVGFRRTRRSRLSLTHP